MHWFLGQILETFAIEENYPDNDDGDIHKIFCCRDPWNLVRIW